MVNLKSVNKEIELTRGSVLANIPDKFMDILPRSFVVLLIIGGLIVVFTSPIGIVLGQWLGKAQSI